MLKQLSEEIITFLMAQSAFTDVMIKKPFPILALGNNVFPLTTYRINELRGITKDADGATFELVFWFPIEQYDECVDFTDAMTTLLKTKYRFVSSTVDLSEETMHYNGIINLEKF
jgi:hypothetical protein